VQPAPAAVLQPIYFDLNKSVIRPDAEETLKANLEWFKQNSDKKVSIQGNCDPRASRKYNHALGLRRANAAKKYLVGLGVDVALLETVSYGKDRPSCQEKNESCWAKERRVDFEPASDTGGATPKASRADRVEARIKDLHSKLKITSAEEEQWNKLAQVMRDNAAAMQPLIEARREKGNMNAVDDLTSYSEIQDAHAAGLKNFIAAFEPLYASMSDDQKKTADQLFTGLGHHKKSKKK
jgi:peptidoglycan-associated lipoprotein